MTEEERWLNNYDPRYMVDALGNAVSDRRRRLFAVACCRLKWKYFTDDRIRRAIELAEKFAEDEGTLGDLDYAAQLLRTAFIEARTEQGNLGLQTRLAAAVRATVQPRIRLWDATTNTIGIPVNSKRAQWLDTGLQCKLVRDIFGNPFRPVAFDPAWRTSDVQLLAGGIYTERAFDRLPILADALQDAGCDSEPLLGHLRDETATHVRGCWALDLVLGKE